MMRSLFAGVSGLKNHQTRLDVLGNNIANVNTVGFKASRVNFQDVLSQTLQGASSGQGSKGGTNPLQVGLGMGLASIDTLFTDGSFQPTGKQTDLSIQGQGFFILSDGLSQVYTRAGNFDFDQQGNFLVPGTGYKVMGWLADSNGELDTSAAITGITIPVGASMPAKYSENLTIGNNLSANSAIGAQIQTSIDVYDSMGNSHEVETTFIKVDDKTWLSYSSVSDIEASPAIANYLSEIEFDDYGTFKSITTQNDPTTTSSLDFSTLQLDSTIGAVQNKSVTVFDAVGKPHVFNMKFTTTSATTWDVEYLEQGVTNATAQTSTATWDGTNYSLPNLVVNSSQVLPVNITTHNAPAAGAFLSSVVPTYSAATTSSPLTFQPKAGASSMAINLNLSSMTQFGGESTAQALDQDGYAAGNLESTSIDPSGIIVGRFTNGKTRNMGQVALATFNNPGGLNKVGSNLYSKSTNSGEAQVGASGTGGRGSFNPGTLEMSNVDLAQEFSNMIITQRGFQANSKIISITDEMLQELANLKR